MSGVFIIGACVFLDREKRVAVALSKSRASLLAWAAADSDGIKINTRGRRGFF
jgi:hypothetical protein